jgi:hypothetical protein
MSPAMKGRQKRIQQHKPLKYLLLGMENGYPLCCVLEFVSDSLDSRLSGLEKGGFHTGTSTYVPCTKCLAEILSDDNLLRKWDYGKRGKKGGRCRYVICKDCTD